jgi:two-component sensor histidine kinase/ABC-type amino acid transport substrate-binding protein
MTLGSARRLALAAAFVLALPLFSAGPRVGADHAIRVVCDDSYPPYCFRGADGEIQGIIPDQWKEWSHQTGRRVEFRGMDWEACQAAMEAGEADVIDSMFRNPEREKVYDFLEPYAEIRVPVFFHQTISGISKPEDLRGFRIAAKAGDAALAVLRDYGITDIREYPDYESIVRAAAASEIRIFCVDEPPALYYLYKLGADSSFRSGLSLYSGMFHRAVRKDRAPLPDVGDLRRVVQEGFDAIPDSVYRGIDRRWFGKALDRRIDPAFAAVASGIVFFVVALLAAFALALRSQVARKTRELSSQAAVLAASERKNRAFIQALPDLFIILDRDCRYRECKTANPEFLFRPEAELLGKTLEEAGLPADLIALLRDSVAAALSDDRVVVCEYELDVIAGRRSFEARIVRMEAALALVIVRDITARARAERKLRDSLAEKEVLIKEVHHRVKNNLQVISSLIQLQSATLHDERDVALLEEMQQRIKSMALIHERLYRSDDLSSIDCAEYVKSVVADLQIAYLEVSGGVRVRLDLDSFPCSMDVAVPIGLVVNELVSNSFKYAFRPAGGGTLSVSLKTRADGGFSLAVADDGPGLPADWEERSAASLGITLVKLLASQLDGALFFSGEGGTRIELTIPKR